jgi:hypothetical protein
LDEEFKLENINEFKKLEEIEENLIKEFINENEN